ncbi:MAG: class I SAM-dependent methyltransferase, partial [Hyphomicrobiales bacterium]
MTQDHIIRETERVREDWTRRGKHWDSRADEVAELADRFNQPLIEAVGVAPGQSVLDLATGAGEPALTVARMVAPEGSVHCTDLVPEMMEGARRRAEAGGLSNVTFRTADMCALSDEDASFDRSICRFGLMFVPEPARATAEVFRVLKPGGRAGFMVWGPRDDTTMFTVFAEVADRLWGLDDPLIDFDTMCSMGVPGTLSGALEAGGFEGVEEKELRFTPKIPGHLEPWRAQIDMSMGPKLDTLDAEQRSTVEREIKDAFSRYLKDGDYHMTAHI